MTMKIEQLTNLRKAAYEAACLADAAWEDELARVYGNAAADARYDRKRNASTPMLKALRDIKNATAEAWLNLGRIARNEVAA
jgi:hypothetical protein